MNTGQMLLTIGAMVLLSMVILNTNRNYLNTTIFMQETKYGVLATSLATSIIERASGLAFDEETDGAAIGNVNSLTKANKLGPETGEVFDTFDDFDDFNGYSLIDTTEFSAIFNISCIVNYVNENQLNGSTNSRTWHKKITATVTSQFMTDTIRISSIFSYWFFR